MEALATATEETVTADGSIPAGFITASVKNIGTQQATVNGVPLAAGEAKGYPYAGKPYAAIGYSVNGSTLLIMYVL